MTALLANAGVPMLFWQFPAAVAALLPIALIEAVVAWPVLRRPFVAVGWRVLAANALSTFVGIPVAWGVMVIVNLATTGGRGHGFDTPWHAFQSIVLQASWLVPYGDQLTWLVPAATLVLLVPYFIVSVFVERWLLRRLFPALEGGRITRAAWMANVVTYGCLAACTAAWLVRSIPGSS